jgi:hypothetical protein
MLWKLRMTIKDAIKIVNTLIFCEVQWSEYTNNKSQRDELQQAWDKIKEEINNDSQNMS